jgi:hypothetical protein
LIVEPYLIDSSNPRDESGELKQQMLDREFDHPLSVTDSSKWNKFFKDLELWEEIEKDVRRTRSDMTFFIEAVDRSKNKDKDQLRK